jgi:geranylgeranyl reductase family protein
LNRWYDLIVVGGGPAGAALATHLARAGREVVLLDHARFPRDKPCGEFFSPPVRGLLDELGVYDAALRAGARRVPGARIRCGDGRSFSGGYASARSPWAAAGGLSLARTVLDGLLWENAGRAGADTRDGVTVRGLLRGRAGRVVGVRTDQGDVHATLVVGADGGHSRVARDLGVVRPLPGLQKLAIVMHYENVPLAGDAPVEMHLGPAGAVCGFGPGPDGSANVTLVVDRDAAPALASHGAAAYADALLPGFPEVRERLHRARRVRTATCGTFGHTTFRSVADGALLVGDAATFIDPFTGEGVYFALRGAQLAAGTITAALGKGNASARALAPYERARRRELSPKYAVCGLVQRLVHQPALMAWAAPRLARRPALAERILGVTGDMESPYRLLSPAYLVSMLTA